MLGLRETDLVAVALPPGPEWVPVVHEALDAGAAIFPVDTRLPQEAQAALMARARPTAVLRAGGLERAAAGEPADGGTALLLATSGSTGAPRLVELSRQAVEHAVRASADRLGSGEGDTWLCCLTPAHAGGMLVLLRGVLLGAPVRVERAFDPSAFRDADYTAVVPTMLTRLLDARAPLGSFKAVVVGGAPLPPALRARAAGAGATIISTYGLTETCGGVVYDGRPLRDVEVSVGAHDEILVRGPTVMTRYRDDAPATRARLTDGWLRTRDAGAIEDGRLTVLGRLDERIRTGAETVWPDAVEAVLREHPAVADVAVTGKPDEEWGEVVAAYVVPQGEAPSLAELRAHAAERLPRYALPRSLEVVAALPRTASGKLRRAALN